MQHTAPGISRLGIPPYDWWNEALHGVARSGHATMFPQAIGMAATWDTELVHQEGRVIATEARAKYNQAQREGNHSIYFGLTFWSPNINIVRDPRWGRSQETYGEDPFLTSQLGVAFVKGMQGNNPKYLEVVATPKHFDAYSGPEPLRHGFNAQVSPYDLEATYLSPYDLEATYLPAFRATLADAHADSTMCSYNAVNGVPACANPFLLQKILRDDWGFHGYVTSDCGAIGDIAFGHFYTPDLEHASALAVKAGTDTTCGNEYVTLVKAVEQGLIPESDINRAVKRLFTARMRLGMFDPPADVPFNKIPMSEVDSPAHQQLALRAARESMVLLKNNGILPLKPSVKTIAVIGPNAESLPAIEGNYNGTPLHPVLPIDGLLKEFAGKAQILYAQGSSYVSQFPVPVPRTVFHPDEGSSVSGLKAEYFSNADFSGKPELVRTDPQIQFDWNAAAPAQGVPMKAFSVRWSGTLTPPGPGAYTFQIRKFHCYRCSVDERVRVYLDGKLVLERSQSSERRGRGVISSSGYTRRPPEPSFHMHFTDTKPHTFRLEYSHRSPLFGAGLTFEWEPPAEVLRDEAVRVARQADVTVVFVGLSPNLEGEEMPVRVEGFDGGDRTTLGLPPVQERLLEALGTRGKPLVVVLMNGSSLAVDWARQHAAAILEAWYPGQAGGTAIAETLAGSNNPSGRLPLTFYTSVAQLPTFSDYSMRGRTYRYFHWDPLYPFGYGLSYSSFAFSNLHLSSPTVQAGQPLTVEAEVKNTSGVAGDEVAELYIEYPARRGGLLRALKGFERIHLAPGATRRVSFTLSRRDLSMVTEKGERRVMAGSYTVFVGGSQPVEGAQGVRAKFQITGDQKLAR
ncbi:MAG: glycoside hydrolase family 3 C-terminal domain-containing protein [Acidobacteriota bacterium]